MKKIFMALLIAAAVLAAAGCGGETTGGGENGENGNSDERVYIVDLCYVNGAYAETGDEELTAIYYYVNQHIFAEEGAQYFTLLDTTLRYGAEGIESADTMVTDKVRFHAVDVKDGTAFVDLNGDDLSGSSLEEGLLISQIVYSLLGSFEEVDRVQFLIDGETAESLMGHYDTAEPFETGIYPLKW